QLSLSMPALCSCCASSPPPACPLSLHDALPISRLGDPAGGALRAADWQERGRLLETAPDPEGAARMEGAAARQVGEVWRQALDGDRKSTRLNSSHGSSSYAVLCLKKKNNNK